jgi:hypothetical protein
LNLDGLDFDPSLDALMAEEAGAGILPNPETDMEAAAAATAAQAAIAAAAAAAAAALIPAAQPNAGADAAAPGPNTGGAAPTDNSNPNVSARMAAATNALNARLQARPNTLPPVQPAPNTRAPGEPAWQTEYERVCDPNFSVKDGHEEFLELALERAVPYSVRTVFEMAPARAMRLLIEYHSKTRNPASIREPLSETPVSVSPEPNNANANSRSRPHADPFRFTVRLDIPQWDGKTSSALSAWEMLNDFASKAWPGQSNMLHSVLLSFLKLKPEAVTWATQMLKAFRDKNHREPTDTEIHDAFFARWDIEVRPRSMVAMEDLLLGKVTMKASVSEYAGRFDDTVIRAGGMPDVQQLLLFRKGLSAQLQPRSLTDPVGQEFTSYLAMKTHILGVERALRLTSSADAPTVAVMDASRPKKKGKAKAKRTNPYPSAPQNLPRPDSNNGRHAKAARRDAQQGGPGAAAAMPLAPLTNDGGPPVPMGSPAANVHPPTGQMWNSPSNSKDKLGVAWTWSEKRMLYKAGRCLACGGNGHRTGQCTDKFDQNTPVNRTF